ncbi:hypothetical protein C1J03_01020 [Sulfitobacter sp. SK012]|uniref:BatD family protein n=1 Tax=Sulfitobacter sp. SK012 TaxID=1389005 RepID=UPI000E0C66C5|nr:BatD family protein [Sulfitobacter sp. SK012]AXI44734.1 hypothetical protein C1J03_01020 [Sulfitobacter sp. SK012]
MRQIFSIILTLSLALSILAARATAQETAEPLVEVALEQTETIPSQPVKLRVTVLVPTWLSTPVNFPTFEAPNLMVRVFENATTPISKSIEGETWSGVSRLYHLYPMVPGPVQIAAQDLRILWANPGAAAPNDSTFKTDPLEFSAQFPEGSEHIDPFIAATSLTLTQELSQEPGVLKPGDSFTRTITGTITGASPMFLPKLLPIHDIPGMATYPAEPIVSEEVQDSILSGSRTEEVTFIAQNGGSGEVPALDIQWFNLETGEVETATVPGFSLSVDAPAKPSQMWSGLREWAPVVLLGLAVALLVLWAVLKWVRPLAQRYIIGQKKAYLLSEKWAFKQAKVALSKRDLGEFLSRLDIWASRCVGYDPRENASLSAAISGVGARIYGVDKDDQSDQWAAANSALLKARKKLGAHSSAPYDPSRINPLTAGER